MDQELKIPDAIIEAAQTAQLKTGCLASVTIAQWAVESGWGRYMMHANNPFGMKWYQSCSYSFVTRRTNEFSGGRWITIEAKFIHFPDLDTAFVEHGKLLMNPRGPYAKALPLAGDCRKFIDSIAAIYATDPHYGAKLILIVHANGLTRYDLPKPKAGV